MKGMVASPLLPLSYFPEGSQLPYCEERSTL